MDVNSLESPEPIEASEPFEDNPEERVSFTCPMLE